VPELQNIGGGAGILDLAPYTNQLMQLRQLQAAQETRGLENLKNQVEIQKGLGDIKRQPFQLQETQAKAQQEKEKFIQDTFQAALSGDYDRATQGYQQITGKPEIVQPHPDAAKRASGYIVLSDPTTGQSREIDVMGATKTRQRIDLEADLIKRAAEGAQATPTDVSTMAQHLIDQGYAQTPAEATSQARAIITASGRTLTSPDGKIKMRVGDLPKDTIANLGESATQVNAAAGALSPGGPQGAGATDDPNQRIVKRQVVSQQDRDSLTGIFNSNKLFLRDIIPQFMEVANDTTLGQNVYNSTIKDLGAKFGYNDPRYTALKTLTGDTLFKRIKDESGAAFTENEFKQRRALLPNESDTVGQALAKVSALVALNTTQANTKLQTLEATDHDVQGLRRLFSGVDLPNVPGAEAQSVLNNLPPEIRNNRAVMDKLIEVLPPSMRTAADQMLSKAGQPRQGAVGRNLKNALGIGE
jgi:hypothetical protein